MNGPFSLCDCLAGDCGDQDSFEAAMRKAQGGSLFLENVDALPFKGQVALSQLLSRSKAEDTIRARVLASSSHDIHQAAQRQELYAPLLRHLDFLSTVLAPLRCRRGDIRSMCEFFWTEYSGTEDMALSQTAADSLEAFHWPGNVEQLEKVMAKLVVLRKGAQIEALDLQRYAPEVLPPTPANALHNSLNAPRKSNGSEVQLSAPTVKEHAWLAIGSDLSRCHPGVRKAVDYLVKNYSHRVTLGKVAGHACVSPSHLCVLLRRNLGMNFKTLLLFLRVEKAKDLFAGRPELRVTDVSLEVGFSDLGHFEKVFRKFTGCSPSAYRRRLRGAGETTEVPTHGTSHNRFAAAS